MKFNRQLLEEETLQKIKEVNDEAGYRKYLEVPEMVNIVATIMEEKLKQETNIMKKETPCPKCNSKFVYFDGWYCWCEPPILENKTKKEYEELMFRLQKSCSELISEKIELNREIENLKKIINDTLRALPVGSISRHTPESIPERVQDWVKEAAEECMLREKWEACADRLIVYAKEIQATVINQALYEAVCEDIREYDNLKKEFTDGNR